MSLLKTNEIQNYNGSSLTLTASTVSTSAQLNTGGNISVTGSLNVSDDSTTRTNLGLGTIATQDSDSITVTGGTATLGALTVSGSDSGDLVRITQTGSGNALVVEDSANPDSTPFVVDAGGNVGVGTTNIAAKLIVVSSTGGGISIAQGTENFYGAQTHRFYSDNYTSEHMRIDSSGNVGIGTISPNEKLTIRADGSTASQPVAIRLEANRQNGTVGAFSVIETETDGTSSESRLKFYTRPGGGNNVNERMRIDSSGNIGAPSGTNIYNASDQRLKQNITDLSGCLQKVLLMRGVSFNWINDFCDSEAEKTLYGLVAQELQIIDSNLVESFSNNTITAGQVTVENPLRVNEKFIIPMLVESIKEQQALIESQQSQIDSLTARIEALEATS